MCVWIIFLGSDLLLYKANSEKVMSDKDVIVVLGATGAQGGGLVDALLANGKYDVRAVTRNPDSEKGVALKEKGAEVVSADLDDVESLTKAFAGAYGAFFVTNFWESMDVKKEMQQIKNLAEAGKAVGLKHVVNSTLEDTREFFNSVEDKPPTLFEDMYVPHFDGKGELCKLVSESVPTTHLYTSAYLENFVNFGMGPQPDDKGELAINFCLEDKIMPLVSVKDIGRVAAKIFEDKELIGKDVYISSPDKLNGYGMAEVFTKIIGKPVKYNAVPFEVYRTFGYPGAAEMANMLKFYADDPSFPKKRFEDEIVPKLVPDLVTMEQFVEENKSFFSA